MKKSSETLPRASPEPKSPTSLAELARSLPGEILRVEAFQLSQQIAIWEIREAVSADGVYLFERGPENSFTLEAQAGPPPCEKIVPHLQAAYASGGGATERDVATWASSAEDGHEAAITMFHTPLRINATYSLVLCVVREALTTKEAAGLRFLAAIIAPVLGSVFKREELTTELAEARRLVYDSKAEQRAKNAFLARMSHDLRTPLSVVIGFSQLLEMEQLTKKQEEHVQHILNAGRQLNALISQVLELTSLDSGKMTLQLQPVHVSKVIAKCLSSLLPQVRGKQLKVSVDDPEGEAPWVLADSDRFEQILLNLLSNAVKFNGRKGSIGISHYAVDEKRVRIEVRDSGPGVPQSQIRRIFEPFERLGANQEAEGAGIGLALSRALALALGGSLTVESQLGRGSTFILELPAASKPTD